VIKRFVRSGVVNVAFKPIVEKPALAGFWRSGAFAAGTQSLGLDYAQLAYMRAPTEQRPSTRRVRSRGAGLNLRLWGSALRRPLWPQMIEKAASVALIGNFSAYPVFIVRSAANGLRAALYQGLRARFTFAKLSRDPDSSANPRLAAAAQVGWRAHLQPDERARVPVLFPAGASTDGWEQRLQQLEALS